MMSILLQTALQRFIPSLKMILDLISQHTANFCPKHSLWKRAMQRCSILSKTALLLSKKLFKNLGDIFEDGTNEVQDIIAVTILGEMKNDPEMMAVADKYMTEYMSGPVHEVNKITAKKTGSQKA